MALTDGEVGAVVPVSDMERAKEFYGATLGLGDGKDLDDGGRTYMCRGGSRIHVYPSPDNAGASGATIAGWWVDDIEGSVDELTANGVTFEQYGPPFDTDAKGIARLEGATIAWFKDPDGNILSVGTYT